MRSPSFAAFKRQLAPGVRVRVTNRLYPHLSGERTVLAAQSNCLKTTHPEQPNSGIWITWPKAADVIASEHAVDLTDTTTPTGEPWATIEIIA